LIPFFLQTVIKKACKVCKDIKIDIFKIITPETENEKKNAKLCVKISFRRMHICAKTGLLYTELRV